MNDSPLRRFAASPQGDHAFRPAKPVLRRVLGLTRTPDRFLHRIEQPTWALR